VDYLDAPTDWRESLTAILTSPGVTQPPHLARSKTLLKVIYRTMGFALWTLGGWVFAGIVLGLLMPAWVSSSGLDWIAVSIAVLLVLALRPRVVRFGLEFQQLKRSQNAARALQAAKRPPILYLRSFNFDTVTAQGKPWYRFFPLKDTQPSHEQELVERLSRYAPVLSIGRPGEMTPPAGAALRFYVTDDHWKETLAAIVPLCSLVIWATGHTEGLQWEIAHLMKQGRPRQLLLWVHVHVEGGRRARRQAEWTRFTSAYRAAFPKPLPFDVEGVHFIAFDDDWTPRAIPGAGYRRTLGEWRLCFRPALLGLQPFLKQRLQPKS
jgi:hypothetical protein